MSRLPRLSALGGSAENGRNCYLLETPSGSILLDCGVKRIVTPDHVGEYPLLNREIVAGIQAVFLSHAHEDHCAALPLLYALGYEGLVYGSPETIASAGQMIEKWMTFVRKQGGTLPYSSADASKVRYAALALGSSTLGGLRAMTGRSGHTVGSMWIALGWKEEGFQLFYSGDMCTCAASLAYDAPPECDAAVLNCAYAGQILNQDEQYDTLIAFAKDAACSGSCLLLPVPPTGRGCDMLLRLIRHTGDDAQVFAAKSIITNTGKMMKNRKWLRDSLPEETILRRVRPLETHEDYKNACSCPGSILLVTDGMLTTEEGQLCLRLLSDSAQNRVLISGHAAPGTLGGNLLDAAWRSDNAIAMQVGKLIIKVHLDDRDASAMQKHLHARKTVFFHSSAENCESTSALYAQLGAEGICLEPGTSLPL